MSLALPDTTSNQRSYTGLNPGSDPDVEMDMEWEPTQAGSNPGSGPCGEMDIAMENMNYTPHKIYKLLYYIVN